MAYSGKSPNKFVGSIGRALAGASSGRGGMSLARARQMAMARRNRGTNIPSVIATAGASNMSGRIEGIESRLEALESNTPAAGSAQPAEVAPSETQAQAAASQMMDANQTGNAVSGVGGIGIPVPPPATSQAPASEVLGSLMASPFTMRQRANMGPLTFKDQTGDGKITRADVIKARIEGYKK